MCTIDGQDRWRPVRILLEKLRAKNLDGVQRRCDSVTLCALVLVDLIVVTSLDRLVAKEIHSFEILEMLETVRLVPTWTTGKDIGVRSDDKEHEEERLTRPTIPIGKTSKLI